MLLTEGIFLGNHISSKGIKVELAKIEIITILTLLKTQKEVRIFLGNVGYYQRFIANFTKIEASLIKLLVKYVNFCWD